jgi:hypothetical protein
MAFTYVNKNTALDATTITLTGVTAGNLIVLGCKWFNAGSGGCTVSDGTSSFAMGDVNYNAGNQSTQFAY